MGGRGSTLPLPLLDLLFSPSPTSFLPPSYPCLSRTSEIFPRKARLSPLPPTASPRWLPRSVHTPGPHQASLYPWLARCCPLCPLPSFFFPWGSILCPLLPLCLCLRVFVSVSFQVFLCLSVCLLSYCLPVCPPTPSVCPWGSQPLPASMSVSLHTFLPSRLSHLLPISSQRLSGSPLVQGGPISPIP